MIKGLLFDLDGVIVDTNKYHILAWEKIAKDMNLKFVPNDYESMKGVSRLKSIEIIYEINNRELSEEDINTICKLKDKYYLKFIEDLNEDEMFPGVKDFIIDAKEKGYRIALGSSSINGKVVLSKLGIGNFFDAILDGTDLINAKPDSEVFIKDANLLSLVEEECLVFEDGKSGIEAARNCGMKVIGVDNKEIKNECDYFIESFKGVKIDDILKMVNC